MTTLYVKRGRRYHPISEYDPEAMDALPIGAHMVIVEPGVKQLHYHVDPDRAGLLAALQEHEAELIQAITQASEKKVATWGTSSRERRAVNAYRGIMGDAHMMVISRPAAATILDGLKKALMQEAQK
jgi:oxalate decarboxylase/phosphoglucose isomerase-like protein (cupin superfamily)